jgi:alkanesulfonate monooxygenase SsuD/methylene tetrahydromethanopterin reductase-like flavin-dependent oxidoreductase (luciferase family)
MNDCRLLPKPGSDIKLVSAGQSDTGMEFAAKYADYNFILGSAVNTPAAFAPLNTQLLAAAAKTERDVGAYVLFMVIADETDDAAMAKWLRYKEAVDIDALAWMAGQADADKTAGAGSTARTIKLPEGAVNFQYGNHRRLLRHLCAAARRSCRRPRDQRHHADLRRLPDRHGAIRPAHPAADGMPGGQSPSRRLSRLRIAL